MTEKASSVHEHTSNMEEQNNEREAANVPLLHMPAQSHDMLGDIQRRPLKKIYLSDTSPTNRFRCSLRQTMKILLRPVDRSPKVPAANHPTNENL